MPAQPSEADIIFNRASVALAKSQRLIASWLPPKTPEELANTKSEEELENEEKEIFTPVPELLGIGAPLPKDVADGSFKRRELSSNDKLLKQLLGKKATKAAKVHPTTNSSKSPAPSQNLGSRPVKPPIRQEESEDEEEGRASAFKSKRTKQKNISGSHSQDVQSPLETISKKRGRLEMNGNDSDNTDDGDDAIKGEGSSRQLKPTAAGPENKVLRKSTNYLDQVLVERSKKKKKKHKPETR